MGLKTLESIVQQKICPTFRFTDNRDKVVPFQYIAKPISEAKVALISSGGFYLKEDEPFDTDDQLGDASYRKIPKGARSNDLGIAHTHYDHKYVLDDLNCALPLELLALLEKEGKIGSVVATNYSFMGYCLKTEELMTIFAPSVGELLLEEEVDFAILAPT